MCKPAGMHAQYIRASVHAWDCVRPLCEHAVFVLGLSMLSPSAVGARLCTRARSHRLCVPAGGALPCPGGVSRKGGGAARADLCQLSEQLRDLSQLRLRGRPWGSAELEKVASPPASSLTVAPPGSLWEKAPRPRSWRYSLPCRAPRSRPRSSVLSPSCPGIPSSCRPVLGGEEGLTEGTRSPGTKPCPSPSRPTWAQCPSRGRWGGMGVVPPALCLTWAFKASSQKGAGSLGF